MSCEFPALSPKGIRLVRAWHQSLQEVEQVQRRLALLFGRQQRLQSAVFARFGSFLAAGVLRCLPGCALLSHLGSWLTKSRRCWSFGCRCRRLNSGGRTSLGSRVADIRADGFFSEWLDCSSTAAATLVDSGSPWRITLGRSPRSSFMNLDSLSRLWVPYASTCTAESILLSLVERFELVVKNLIVNGQQMGGSGRTLGSQRVGRVP